MSSHVGDRRSPSQAKWAKSGGAAPLPYQVGDVPVFVFSKLVYLSFSICKIEGFYLNFVFHASVFSQSCTCVFVIRFVEDSHSA